MLKTTIFAVAAVALYAGAAPAGQAAPPPGAPLTFAAALDLATSRNLDLEAARRQRAIREAGLTIAREWANPDVSFEATRDTPHENLTFGLPVEIGGQRGRRIGVAREELSLADLDVRAAMATLRRNLRLAFYGLLAADQRVRLANEVLDLAERARSVAQARFDEGDVPRLDVLQADLGVARARTDADLARATRASALADLNAVLNQPPGRAVSVVGDLGEAPPIPGFDRAIALAGASNVAILSAGRDAAVEGKRLDLLRADRVPTPTVTFGLPMNAPGEYNVGASVGVMMTVPLFSRNQGEIAQSQATIDQAHAMGDAARRQVESQVYSALARIEAQRQQVESFRTRVVPAAEELATLAEESYKAGRDSVLALLDAQRSLRDVRLQYLQALLDFQAALADLEEVIGGPIA